MCKRRDGTNPFVMLEARMNDEHWCNRNIRSSIYPLDPKIYAHGKFCYYQMDHHGGILSHQLQQTEIPHQFLWPHYSEGQAYLPTKYGMGQNHQWRMNMDTTWRLQHDLQSQRKRGWIRRLDGESGHLQSLIDKICLINLETHNGLFTWSNQHSGSQ